MFMLLIYTNAFKSHTAKKSSSWLYRCEKPLSLPHQISRQLPVFLTAAEVVKLVDTHVSGACVARHAGSSPAFGTKAV